MDNRMGYFKCYSLVQLVLDIFVDSLCMILNFVGGMCVCGWGLGGQGK